MQRRPTAGAAATRATEVRILYDDQALWIGARLAEPAADGPRSALGRRDYDLPSDWLHVLIDSYHDRRTAFRFAVNPSGVRQDASLSGDEEWSADRGWNAVWDVATAIERGAWTAEFRIPWSALRLRDAGDSAERRVGIQFIRDDARTNERSVWAPMPPDAITETQRSIVHLLQRPDRTGTIDSTRTSLEGTSLELFYWKQGGSWRWGVLQLLVTDGFEANDLGYQPVSSQLVSGGWLGREQYTPSRHLRSWSTYLNLRSLWTLERERKDLAASLFAEAELHPAWRADASLGGGGRGLSVQALRGGPALANPDFHVRELLSNAILRWELRPGSSLFLVWSQTRDASGLGHPFSPSADVRRLLGASPRNVLLAKVSWWTTR